MLSLNGALSVETTEFMASKVEEFGGPDAYNHYAVGWAHAMDTPYQWTKQVASHWGGTRNATVVHWPNGFESRGEVRSQFSHVIDVATTVLDAAGIPQPTFVNGVQQEPLHGKSMVPSFDDADAPEFRTTQYFEMFVNRGIYHEGWTAVTRHSTPWALDTAPPPIDQDVWELYGPDDWTQSRDLAGEMPDKLAELQTLFLIEAAKYNVLPLDDRRVERVSAALAGRPTLIQGNTQLLFSGMGRLSEHSILDLKNRSHSITAVIEVPDSGAHGVVMAQGGAFGGWSVYAHEGVPAYCYNLFGVQQFKVRGSDVMEPGERQVRVEFHYDGGGFGKGGTATLYVDGTQVGEGRIDGTVPMIFSLDETADIGRDTGTSVTDDLTVEDSEFNGRIRWIQLDVDEDAKDADHLVSPEERFRIAMARQ
jgi:arylsulfatase